jgi:hypothetical protein
MAQFEGTIKEFTKFIGAYARNKVFYITSKYKKQVGKCQDCESTTKGLEAAHINGFERPILIGNILSQFIEGDIIKIDLNEFDERFINAHFPLEKTIRILCKECHRKYDNLKQVHELGTEDQVKVNETNLEMEETKEGQIIEDLVKNKSMNKTKALKIGKTTFLTYLNNSNTIFSNIISTRDEWWLQPNNKKFQSDLYFILNDAKSKTLYFFNIPGDSIKNPETYFRQRNDQYRKDCSDIYIPVSASKFTDKNGFDFTKFLIEKHKY